MKPFALYLAESTKTFDYRIKICGDYGADFMKDFKEQLKKFDVASMSDLRTTPVIAKPSDFPDQVNQRVTMIDVKFRYPATPPQIEQMAELCGFDPNCICMHQLDWAEGMDTELLGLDDQKDLLTSDYPADTKEQKKLSKDYANGNQQVIKNSAENAVWTVAGGKTPKSQTTNDLPQGVSSPMTAMKRPPRPNTGRQPKGN